jgi:hypothetical protein
MSRTIYDMTAEDLGSEVIGQRITAIEGKEIYLSNGKVLEIEDAHDCCAWFDGEIRAFDFADNMVTGIEFADSKATENGADEAWKLRVLSNHKTLAEIDIQGNSSNGYYCHSVILRVKGEK